MAEMMWLQYGPLAFQWWCDVIPKTRSTLDVYLEARCIEYGKSQFYTELKQHRKASHNG